MSRITPARTHKPKTPIPDAPLVERLTQQLAAQKGVADPKGMALALLIARGHANKDGRLTATGKARDALGAEGRAKDRAVKRSPGHKLTDFSYDALTNSTKLRRQYPKPLRQIR